MASLPSPPTPGEIRRLVDVAAGRAPADLVVRGGKVVNVFTEEIQAGLGVAVVGDRIAAVAPEQKEWFGPDTQVVEAAGAYLIPGLIDAHTHLDSIFQLSTYSPLALATGNTTAVTETAMIAGAVGARGVEWLLAEAGQVRMRIAHLAPPLVPPFPEFETSAGMNLEEFSAILSKDGCVGVGEIYWPAVTQGQQRVYEEIALALERGLSVEGHAAGAKGSKLVAYKAAGITACHEAITAEEALERLRLGMAVEVREGMIRREMQALVPALKQFSDGVMLVSDLAPLEWLAEARGVINPLLARAVELGVAPARAVRWVTLNPARHFGMSSLGAIAPGYAADMVVVEELNEFKAAVVILGGEVVAGEDRELSTCPTWRYPPEAYNTITAPIPAPEELRISARGPQAKLRVIQLDGPTITRLGEVLVKVKDSQVEPDPAADVLKLVHIQRQGKGIGVGFVRGTGLKRGAVGTTLIWDTCNMLIIGTSDEEIVAAAAQLKAMGGGLVAVSGEEVVARVPLPICGIISPDPVQEIIRQLQVWRQALKELGWKAPRAFLTMQTLAFTGLPFVRLTDKGLVDVRKGEVMEVVA